MQTERGCQTLLNSVNWNGLKATLFILCAGASSVLFSQASEQEGQEKKALTPTVLAVASERKPAEIEVESSLPWMFRTVFELAGDCQSAGVCHLLQLESNTEVGQSDQFCITYAKRAIDETEGNQFMAQTNFIGVGLNPCVSIEETESLAPQSYTEESMRGFCMPQMIKQVYAGSNVLFSSGLELLCKVGFYFNEDQSSNVQLDGLLSMPLLTDTIKLNLQPRFSFQTNQFSNRCFLTFNPIPLLTFQCLFHASDDMHFSGKSKLNLKINLSLTQPLYQQLGFGTKPKRSLPQHVETLLSVA